MSTKQELKQINYPAEKRSKKKQKQGKQNITQRERQFVIISSHPNFYEAQIRRSQSTCHKS